MIDRLDVNEFTGKGFAQEEQAPLRLDLAAGALAADLDMAGIVGVGGQAWGAGAQSDAGNRWPRPF